MRIERRYVVVLQGLCIWQEKYRNYGQLILIRTGYLVDYSVKVMYKLVTFHIIIYF